MAKRGQSLRKTRAVRRPAKPTLDPKQRIAELERELARALERQAATSEALTATSGALTATSDVLKVISRSTFDLEPVLTTLTATAARLCEAEMGFVTRRDGDVFRFITGVGSTPETTAVAIRVKEMARAPDALPFVAGRETITGRVVQERRPVQIADITADREYNRPAAITVANIRTLLGVPLLREGELIGSFTLARQRVEPFTERQIELVRTFADQAVIAIENTRLLTETREALEQQTATAEVLQVINSSPGDLAPVFDAMLEKALELCGAAFGILWTYDGTRSHAAAMRGVPPALAELLTQAPHPVGPDRAVGRLLRGEAVVHVADAMDDKAYRSGDPLRRAMVDLGGMRTLLGVPLRKDNAFLGAFTIYRQEVRPFSDKEIVLLENFAAQAVIATENARLITETREALEQQTATAEVLQVINSSPGDLAPVFDAMLEKALRLCQAAFGILRTYDGTSFQLVAERGVPEAFLAFTEKKGLGPSATRAVEGRRAMHIVDVMDTDIYRSGDPYRRAIVELAGARTLLVVPLLKDNAVRGIFTIYRQEVRPFTEKQISLLQNFATQAVIAMENARLLGEVRQRNDELAEALEFQTATGEVLRIVASSPDHLQPVFDAMLEKATELCGAKFGNLLLYDGEAFTVAADRNVPSAYAEALRAGSHRPRANTGLHRLIRTKTPVHIVDMREDTAYREREPLRVATVELGGVRSMLLAPLLKKGKLVGAFAIYREESGGFAESQIALVSTFADQAVIAIENARLFGELRQRTTDLARSVDELTATGDVLKIISRSSVDLETVLETLVETVARLCRADQAAMTRRRGDMYHLVASFGLSDEAKEFVRTHPFTHDRRTITGRVMLERRAVHVADVLEDPEFTYLGAQKIQGNRTMLGIPLLREEALLGIFMITRTRVDPFTDKEIELATTFADQAVIAIENARLFEELRDRQAELARSVDELTATGDVLKIISRSSVDLETVLDTLVETVARLCRADQTYMFRRRDDKYHMVASHGLSKELKEFVLTHPLDPDRGTVSGRVALERRAVHIPDVLQDPEFTYGEGQRLAGNRTMLGIPLLREDTLIGIFSIHRTRVEPFTEKEIELATTFADQAVIAIENARLFDQLRERQTELARSVDELTATGDVLKIISRSSVDLEIVLETLVETVARLCRADQGNMFRRRDDMYHLIASHGLTDEAKEFVLAHPFVPGRGSLNGRVAMDRRAVHIPDVLEDPEYVHKEAQKVQGYRTMLGVPLLRGDSIIGIFVILRTRVEPFTDKEIELATSFADQAVIAIENARLFEELRERQAELRVTFDNMGDGVAMFDAAGRLAAWNRNFQQIADLSDALLAGRPTYADYIRILTERGELGTDGIDAELNRLLQDTELEVRRERTRPDGRIIEVRRNPVPGGGFVLIYADITERKHAEAAISAARDAAEAALRELQTAQASLVHAQKMAALGQLTAGIAHEIKNPLNFVNNFAGLSVELLDELKEASALAMGALDAGKRAEITETIQMLTGNLEKIAEHGRRADGIVKSMLQHSRGGSGDWQSTDLNALVEEALNLAYHGARAQDQSFNITMERDLDQNLAPIEVVPQDVMRVFLNLIGNGFYAANKRRRGADGAYRPVLRVATREVGDVVEVRVRDNGVGISSEHREKLFQPFFTTKPTGEGTGLGLSISYDIVSQQHGGTITVDSEPGDFTEFTVRLPRRQRASARKGP